MKKTILAVCALLAGILPAGVSRAQSPAPLSTTSAADKALIDALIKKGLLTADEARQITDSVAKASAGDDVVTKPTDKYIKDLVLTGRFQAQFADLGTSIDGFQNSPPTTLPAHPVASEHFLMRRIYLGTKVDFTGGFSGFVNYDFANLSFDAAYIEWKQSDALFIDAGFRKVPFDYEEVMSSGDLKAIERSPITRYFDEPNNGRRLGAASYRTGIFAGGTQDGFFYNVAVTNPERNEYSGDSTSGPSVNGSGGVGNYSNSTNNTLAYYGWAGYGGKFTDGSYKLGVEGGVLPDQGGPGTSVGVGNNLSVYGAFADITAGGFNLQAEYLDANSQNAVTVAGVLRAAKPKGYWVQPSFYIVPKKLEAVLRYSAVDSDNRGVALSDGIRGATSGGTMDKMDELYVGGNWYIVGNDVKLQFGYIHGESKDPLAPTTPTGVVATGTAVKASTDGVRSQVQVNF
jgi:Phosphate-selective porin O and P